MTGASSGIGRATALELGRRGASVVLAARNEDALAEVVAQVERAGGRAHAVPTDVTKPQDVEGLAAATVERFGAIDAWINNAAVSLYATVEESSMEEIARVIDVDLRGVVRGVKAALPHMKRQGFGTIVNNASTLGERSVPLQSAYCAAKHGVVGFTESLRLEVARERADIRVVLVLPSSINTPFFEHARSKLGVLPRAIPPVYEPRVVADAIARAVEAPVRDVFVGGAGKLLQVLRRLSPALVDRYMLVGDNGARQQRSDEPDDGVDNLFEPVAGTGSVAGRFGERALPRIAYTTFLEHHPGRKRALIAGAAAALFLAERRRNGS